MILKIGNSMLIILYEKEAKIERKQKRLEKLSQKIQKAQELGKIDH
jgi:hypothetical protein